MKKFLILLLICIISLSLFACDTPPTDTTTDTETADLPTENNYIKASLASKEETEEFYYTKIFYRFGEYLGHDLPYNAYKNPYYKVVKSYESFCELFSNGENLDEEVFEENYILLIYMACEGEAYEIGFNNFEMGELDFASIDYTRYYSSAFPISDCASWHINVLLLPNTTYCYENNFRQLNINKSIINTYSYSKELFDKFTLYDNEALIFASQEQYDTFREKYDSEYYGSLVKKNSIYIAFKSPRYAIAFENVTLDNNKLTIKVHTTEKALDDITVIEIPREEFTDEIPSNVSLEIQYKIHSKNNNDLSVTEEEWLNAFDFNFDENTNLTEEIHLSYIKINGEQFSGICKCLTTETKRAEIADGFQYYYDYENNCYYEAKNGIWIKHNNVDFINDSAFFFYDFSPIKYAYDSAAYTDYSQLYVIDEYEEYTNIKLKIEDGKLVYISFTHPSAWRENSKDTFKIYYSNFGTTEINLPKEGNNAPTGMVAINRAEKVNINLDYHHSYMDKVEEENVDKTKHYAGYICINQNGNEYIAYAPNVHSYYTAITIDENPNSMEEVYSKIYRIENEYFNDSPEYTKIDIIEIGNVITIYFPNFDSYFECQEYMLDTLSQIEAVKSIDVGYIEAQDTNTMNFETYETIVLSYQDWFETDWLCTSYEDLKFACRNMKMPANITEETFNEYYVFIVNSYDYRNKVSDAKLVGNTVYLTNNRYYTPNTLEDAIDRSCSFVVLVPKAELGDLPEEVTVKTIITLVIDGSN